MTAFEIVITVMAIYGEIHHRNRSNNHDKD